jgi:hypothetical protein
VFLKNSKDNIYKLFEIDSINLAMNKIQEKNNPNSELGQEAFIIN